jgi:hypothetical protein
MPILWGAFRKAYWTTNCSEYICIVYIKGGHWQIRKEQISDLDSNYKDWIDIKRLEW